MTTDPHFQADVQELVQLLQTEKSLQDFRSAFENAEDLQEFAQRAEFFIFEQGFQVVVQGQPGNDFLIVLSGQLRAVDVGEKKPRLLGYFTRGAILGERALLYNEPRSATVEVVSPNAKLAVFNKDDWYWLMGKNSRFRDFFENLSQSRLKQSAIDFPGRQWDEVVVASTKRHWIAYVATLWLPITLLIVPILFVLLARLTGIDFLVATTDALSLLIIVPFILLAALLAVYNYFDWRNDDFIVTTKRVVHIERILFFGEQREDAPLTRIQDVTLHSDILDRIFDSDNILIKTAGAGVIRFDHIRKSQEIRNAIFRERERAKARVAAADVAALRYNIAETLNYKEEVSSNVMAVAEAEGIIETQPKTRHYNKLVDYFIPRMKEVNEGEKDTVIIWRKHLYVLLSHILLPILAFFVSLYLFIASFALWLPPFGVVVAWPVQIGLGIAVIASLFWYIWEYDDWSKDVYIVTGTQIIDIEASSFRLVRSRREGTFDNIQGVYSEVPNLFYKLINMGNVIIETAGTQETFTFRQVFDPASVNQEIFNRWALYKQREREARRDATSGQIIEVLKEYHKLTQKVEH